MFCLFGEDVGFILRNFIITKLTVEVSCLSIHQCGQNSIFSDTWFSSAFYFGNIQTLGNLEDNKINIYTLPQDMFLSPTFFPHLLL